MDVNEIQRAIKQLPAPEQVRLARWQAGRLAVQLARAAMAGLGRSLRAALGPKAPDNRVFFRSPALYWTISSLLLFVLAEGAIFRVGWYNKYLQPNSSAGAVEYYLYWLGRTRPAAVPEVMVLGDSRIEEGFSARIANAASGYRLNYWNFGIPGSTPRVWYYILRDADPKRTRFGAIVVALDHYADEDAWDSKENRPIDLNWVIGRLHPWDCWDFAASMGNAGSGAQVFGNCLFRGLALRRDVQEFLGDRAARLKLTKDWRNNGLGYVNGYAGNPQDLQGLTADFEKHTINIPPGVTGTRRDTVFNMVIQQPTPQKGELMRYRQLWLGRIVDLYRNSKTKIVFIELPRAPLPKPESPTPATALKAALSRPGVAALPAATFRDLERPEYFADGLHLNVGGREIFSTRLGKLVPPLTGVEVR